RASAILRSPEYDTGISDDSEPPLFKNDKVSHPSIPVALQAPLLTGSDRIARIKHWRLH
ncbi:hypothetical protein KC334_g7520, partial [Hortaea werneckii]